MNSINTTNKNDFKIKKIFHEAAELAKSFRWSYCLFLAVFFLLYMLVSHAVNFYINGPFGSMQYYLSHWIVSPIIASIIFACLIIAVENKQAMRFFNKEGFENYQPFDRFTNLFFVALLNTCIPNMANMIIMYPSVEISLHKSLFLLMIAAMVFSLVVTAFILFSIFIVLFENKKPLKSLKMSCASVKPVWPKMLGIVFLSRIVFIVTFGLLAFAGKKLFSVNQSSYKTLELVVTELAAIAFAVWILPIMISMYLVAYKNLVVV